ncbi:MAG: DUF192 domain-containing protein [Bryobacteraceae bacterium]
MPEAVYNRTTGQVLARRVVRCNTVLRRFRGLMFRRPLDEDEVYLFILPQESRLEAAIHMFFVFFPIAVVWLDGEHRVVDKALARPWRPFYAPRRPARYFLEGHPALLEQVAVGDEIDLVVQSSGGASR